MYWYFDESRRSSRHETILRAFERDPTETRLTVNGAEYACTASTMGLHM